MEAAAIMATTKQAAAAKKLLDWSVTEEANKLYAANFAIVALPGIQAKLEHISGDVEKMLAKNDFAWAAANRERILAEWSKRYDRKAQSSKIGSKRTRAPSISVMARYRRATETPLSGSQPRGLLDLDWVARRRCEAPLRGDAGP